MLRRNLLKFLGAIPFMGFWATNSVADTNIILPQKSLYSSILYTSIYIPTNYSQDCYYLKFVDRDKVEYDGVGIPISNKELNLSDIKIAREHFMSEGHRQGYAYLIWATDYNANKPSPTYLKGICFSPLELTPEGEMKTVYSPEERIIA